MNLIFYNFYITEDAFDISKSTHLKKVKCTYEYRMILGPWRDELNQSEIYEFESYLAVPEIVLPEAGKVSGPLRLFLQQINEKILVTTSVASFNISQKSFCPVHLYSPKPLSVDDVIDAVDKLSFKGREVFNLLEEQRQVAVSLCCGNCKSARDTYQSRSILAMEIFEVANADINPNKPILCQDFVHRFSWEIAALLGCFDDRIRLNHAWRKLTKEEVQKTTSKIRSSTGAYATLTSGPICIEVFHYEMLKAMTPELAERTTERLIVYGYDSTSIYLWEALAILAFVTSYYNMCLSNMLYSVHTLLGTSSGNSQKLQDTLSRIIELKLEIYGALDKTYWSFDTIVDPRRLEFFREGVANLRLGDEIRQVEVKLNALSSIFTDISQTVTSVDENTTIREIRDLGIASDNTNKIIMFLSALTAVTVSLDLANLIIPILSGNFATFREGLIALIIFSCIILSCLYVIRHYSKKTSSQKHWPSHVGTLSEVLKKRKNSNQELDKS
jgi:hypothetical protein